MRTDATLLVLLHQLLSSGVEDRGRLGGSAHVLFVLSYTSRGLGGKNGCGWMGVLRPTALLQNQAVESASPTSMIKTIRLTNILFVYHDVHELCLCSQLAEAMSF